MAPSDSLGSAPGRFGRVGLTLLAAGGLVTAIGIAGIVGDWGSTSTSTESAGAVTATSAPAETPAQFLSELGQAIRAGDASFLFDRLNPAVTARYGAAVCRSRVGLFHDATAAFDVVSVQGTADYAWTTDNQTTTVPATTSVLVNVTSNGRSAQQTVHLTKVGARFTWFTDCTP